MTREQAPGRLSIAILALGGQGGGVLADWIHEAASRNGYIAQATSVPGVAQRTGSTIYYLELYPADDRSRAAPPVLALSPVPGDVDVVIASELMEAGRALVRGYVGQHTSMIASTNRIYAIAEKSAMSDGRLNGDRILEAAQRRAGLFIGYDMEAVAQDAGSVISSVMLGALSASGALPFSAADYREAIRAGGKSVEANLRGFDAGRAAASRPASSMEEEVADARASTIPADFEARVDTMLPREARSLARLGVQRMIDYQDRAYARLYLARLEATVRHFSGSPDLAAETARYLALWMSYEDVIRVADLKTRAERFERVRQEVGAGPETTLSIVEFMHPRYREVCETLPVPLGAWLLASSLAQRLLAPLFRSGRKIRTTGLRGFLLLRALAGLRGLRPLTLRYRDEQRRIEAWLARIAQAAASPEVAIEVVRCQQLVKGYGETFERGLARFERIMAATPGLQASEDGASRIAQLLESALADEDGHALSATFERLAA